MKEREKLQIAETAIREVNALLDRLANGEEEGKEYAITNAMATIAVVVTGEYGHSHKFSQVLLKAKERYSNLATATWK